MIGLARSFSKIALKPWQCLAALILLSLAELGSTVLMTRWFGPLRTYVLFASLMAAGLLLQAYRWHSDVRPMVAIWSKIMMSYKKSGNTIDPFSRRSLVGDALMGQLMIFWLETGLLLLPGLITSGLSFILMVMFWNYKALATRKTWQQARAEAMAERQCPPGVKSGTANHTLDDNAKP